LVKFAINPATSATEFLDKTYKKYFWPINLKPVVCHPGIQAGEGQVVVFWECKRHQEYTEVEGCVVPCGGSCFLPRCGSGPNPRQFMGLLTKQGL